MDKIANLLKKETIFSRDINIEKILYCWFLSNKYYKEHLDMYEESDINNFFCRRCLKKLFLSIDESEVSLLLHYLPTFIERSDDKKLLCRTMQYTFLKGMLGSVKILKTFHNTEVYMSSKGEISHYKFDERTNGFSPLYAYQIAPDRYMFFILFADLFIYVNQFNKDGFASLSILPELFEVAVEEKQTILIKQYDEFVSAFPDGSAHLVPQGRNWEKFFLIELTDNALFEPVIKYK